MQVPALVRRGPGLGWLILAALAAAVSLIVEGASERRVEAGRERLEATVAEIARGVIGEELGLDRPEASAGARFLLSQAEAEGLDELRVLRLKEPLADQVQRAPDLPRAGAIEVQLTTRASDSASADEAYSPDMANAFFSRTPSTTAKGGAFGSTTVVAYAPLLGPFGSTVAVLEVRQGAFAALLLNLIGSVLDGLALALAGAAALKALSGPVGRLLAHFAEQRQAALSNRRAKGRPRDLSTKLADAWHRFERAFDDDVEPGSADLSQTIDAAIRSVESLAEQKGIAIRTHLPGELRREVIAQPHLVFTVLEQLLDNAVRYSRRSRSVTLRVVLAPNGDSYRLEVVDDGMGIRWSEQEHLSAAMQTPIDGASEAPSGLDVARAAVEAIGGDIGFESQKREGTRFWFTVRRTADRELQASA